MKGKGVVIVDDIVSTEYTIVEASKLLEDGRRKDILRMRPRHLCRRWIEKLKDAKIEVISSNTIPNETAKIDVSGLIAESLR